MNVGTFTPQIRELNVNELEIVVGGDFYTDLGGAVFGGAIAGGLFGSVAGGIGAGPGAFAGGVGAGIGYIGSELYKSYF
jgi:hypothetical protein